MPTALYSFRISVWAYASPRSSSILYAHTDDKSSLAWLGPTMISWDCCHPRAPSNDPPVTQSLLEPLARLLSAAVTASLKNGRSFTASQFPQRPPPCTHLNCRISVWAYASPRSSSMHYAHIDGKSSLAYIVGSDYGLLGLLSSTGSVKRLACDTVSS